VNWSGIEVKLSVLTSSTTANFFLLALRSRHRIGDCHGTYREYMQFNTMQCNSMHIWVMRCLETRRDMGSYFSGYIVCIYYEYELSWADLPHAWWVALGIDYQWKSWKQLHSSSLITIPHDQTVLPPLWCSGSQPPTPTRAVCYPNNNNNNVRVCTCTSVDRIGSDGRAFLFLSFSCLLE